MSAAATAPVTPAAPQIVGLVKRHRPASIWVAPFENQRASAFDTEENHDYNEIPMEDETSTEPAKDVALPDPARLEGPYDDGRFEQLRDILHIKGVSLNAIDRQFCSELVHLEMKTQSTMHAVAKAPTPFSVREELDEMVVRTEERKALFLKNFHKTCILDRFPSFSSHG